MAVARGAMDENRLLQHHLTGGCSGPQVRQRWYSPGRNERRIVAAAAEPAAPLDGRERTQ